MGPHPAVAAIRLAVRRVLHDVLQDVLPGAPAEDARHAGAPSVGVVHADAPHTGVPRGGVIGMRRRPGAPGAPAPAPAAGRPLVLAACSGGADSMALASALAFEAGRARRAGRRGHRRPRTPERFHRPGARRRGPAARSRSRPGRGGRGDRRPAGRPGGRRPRRPLRGAGRGRRPRSARSPCCSATPATTRPKRCCSGWPAAPAPARCPGWPRSPAPAAATAARSCCWTGTPPARRAWSRASTVWEDPHNADPAYTRSRVRHEALPVLEKSLGSGRGRGAGPYRTAVPRRRRRPGPVGGRRRPGRRAGGRPDGALDGLPAGTPAARGAAPGAAARRRSRRAAPAGSLFARHIEEIDRLVTDWRGQGPLNLPGGVEAPQVGWQTGLPARNRSRMTDRRSEPAGHRRK